MRLIFIFCYFFCAMGAFAQQSGKESRTPVSFMPCVVSDGRIVASLLPYDITGGSEEPMIPKAPEGVLERILARQAPPNEYHQWTARKLHAFLRKQLDINIVVEHGLPEKSTKQLDVIKLSFLQKNREYTYADLVKGLIAYFQEVGIPQQSMQDYRLKNGVDRFSSVDYRVIALLDNKAGQITIKMVFLKAYPSTEEGSVP